MGEGQSEGGRKWVKPTMWEPVGRANKKSLNIVRFTDHQLTMGKRGGLPRGCGRAEPD